MRILFVTNTFKILSNLNSGASNRSTMFIKALANFANVDIVSFLGDEITTPLKNCEIIYSKAFPLTMPRKHGRLHKFMCLFNTWNPETLYPKSEEKTRIVSELLKQKHYDYIACRYLSEAVDCGLLQYADKLIVDIDDNPTAVFIRDLRKNMQYMTLRNRLYNKLYIRTVDKLTKNIISKIRVSFYSNLLEDHLPQSVYLHNVSPQEGNTDIINNATPNRILMVGFFKYFPNPEGAKHFVNNILPNITKVLPHVEFHIVGKIEDDNLKKELMLDKHVVLKGFVDDLASEYRDSRVIVVPIYSGTGTSVKVAEAMKMNRPFVSTERYTWLYSKTG